LLRVYRALLERCATSAPDDIEISALAAMLHSFYNGDELDRFFEAETGGGQ
jgi:predicted SpoU family rRNA methylase